LDISELQLKAEEFFRQGDYYQAIRYFDKAIQLNSDDAIDFSNRGASKFQVQDYDGAIEDCSTAIQMDPTLLDPHICIGNSLRDKGDTEGALSEYTKAIDKNSKFYPAYMAKGKLKRSMQDYGGGYKRLYTSATLRT